MLGVLLQLAVCIALVGAKKVTNSCYDADVKKIKHFGCIPKIPKTMCASCPLKTSNLVPVSSGGGFKSCNNMYNLDAPGCKEAMKKYVDDNKCDTKTGGAWTRYYMQNKNDRYAQQVLDRVLYTVCEFCCDCVPCGTTLNKSHQQIVAEYKKEENTAVAPTNAQLTSEADVKKPAVKKLFDKLIKPMRRNCVLHVPPDNCQLYPDLYVTLENGQRVEICDVAREWKETGTSAARKNQLGQTLFPALKKLTIVYGCALSGVWDTCREMEQNFGRLKTGHNNC